MNANKRKQTLCYRVRLGELPLKMSGKVFVPCHQGEEAQSFPVSDAESIGISKSRYQRLRRAIERTCALAGQLRNSVAFDWPYMAPIINGRYDDYKIDRITTT
jgi:hypothetical protein